MSPGPTQPVLLQTVLDGPHGLVHAALRASGALVLLALLVITGDLLLSGLHCCFLDLRANAGHLDHPSLTMYVSILLRNGLHLLLHLFAERPAVRVVLLVLPNPLQLVDGEAIEALRDLP